MQRNFRHLTSAEIQDIILAYNSGENQASLARRYGVDHSTIHYHVQRFERAYPEQESVYAIIKAQVRRVCVHPSGRCNFCGEMWDGLMRVERERIAILEKQLADAHSRLRVAGLLVE